MSRNSFEKLCAALAYHIERQDTHFRSAISVRERIAIALYRLADTVSYRTIPNLFGIGKSTECTSSIQVCKSIMEVMLKGYVWLPAVHEVEDEIAGFYNLAGFPQVVGAVDGCHVPIMAPQREQRRLCKQKKVLLHYPTRTCWHWLFFQRCSHWLARIKKSYLYDACSIRSFLPLDLVSPVNVILTVNVIPINRKCNTFSNRKCNTFSNRKCNTYQQ